MIQDADTELPKGMELVDLMSIKSFWDASVHNVIETLLEAQPGGYGISAYFINRNTLILNYF